MAKNIRLSDHFTYGKLLCFTLPSMVMMVFTSIYGVVDGLFVSNFVGKTAFASVNLVMPFVMILGGMGFMIGTGGTALVSKILGEGDPDNANRTFSMMVLFTLALGAVLSGIGIAFMGPVARFLGATDAMMADCVLYGRIVTGFTFAFMLQNVFQSFFIAAEKPKLGLKVTVAAGVTNMVLDALFIAVFKWGVAGAALATGLTVAGVLLLICALAALPSAIYWLPEALTEGGSYWTWLVEDSMPMLMSLTGGIGCLFGANHIRTTRRMRKKIDNIVGDAKYMYIQDIADAIPCSYEKCCKHLENCIDEGLFGPGAFLDMHRKCLVVKERPPEPTPAPAPAPKPQKADPMPEADQYQKILDELRRVNDAIPDEEMTDKISRLEAVSAKIFEQARTDPDKLPQMRKFMDYYLPTSLKLLNTYAELDKQGIEGENISESKHRIEQTMDTLVKAFETQLDKLFASDALDVSTDIDVMQNMLRADGLTDDAPFKL